MTKRLLAIVTFAMAAGPARAQQPSPQPAVPGPAADSNDVRSVDAILHALYDVISGPAGKERDWNRFRSLTLPRQYLP